MSFREEIISLLPHLKNFSLRFTKNDVHREELVSETVLKALSSESKFKSGTNLKAWLYTIMQNLYINEYRKIARFGVHEEIGELKSDSLVLEQDIDFKIQLMQIRLFLDNQSEKSAKSIILYSQGYKYEEISEIMNEPIGTIKSRIFNMRKKLIKL